MDFPKHFSLHSENDSHFSVHDKRDGTVFHVAKKGIHPANQIKIMKMQKFDEGGDVESSPQDNTANSEQATNEQQAPYFLQANPQETQPQAPQPQTSEAPSTPEMQPQIPVGAAQAGGTSSIQDVKNLVNTQAGAINKEAKAQSDINAQQAAKWQSYLDDENMRNNDYQTRLQTYQNNADKLTKDIADTKIDPKRYWHNASTGQKISAGIAMVLGGLGQGLLRGGPNAGLAAVQDTINKDIESQKTDLGKKQSLLGDNLRIQGNLMAAENASRLHANSILQGELQKTALQSSNPLVMAKAQGAIAQLKLQAMPMLQNVAMNQTKLQVLNALQKGNVSNQDPSKFVQWVVPQTHQKDVFNEIERAQDTRRMSQNIMQTFDQAAKEVHGMPGVEQALTLGHYPATSVGGLHQALQPTFKDLEGTVRQAAMDNTFENVSPTPMDTASRIADKRKFLEEYLKSKMSAPTAKGFGIDLDKFNSTSGYQSPQFAVKGGVKYQKVPGGWAPAKE